MVNRPKLQVLAGVNGAGKSTLHNEVFDKNIPFINPDVIARRISPDNFNDLSISREAGREAILQTKEHLSQKLSFSLETTLSGQQPLKVMRQAREMGFIVELHFVGLADKEQSIDRVAHRVELGGHNIPRDILERRYDKSMDNLSKAMLLSDNISIYDNSGKNRRLIFEQVNGMILHRLDKMPEWADKAINRYEQEDSAIKRSDLISYYKDKINKSGSLSHVDKNKLFEKFSDRINNVDREKLVSMHKAMQPNKQAKIIKTKSQDLER